jgi:hypothetical protein
MTHSGGKNEGVRVPKTGSVEEEEGKEKREEERSRQSRIKERERRYETCFPTHLDRGLVSRAVSTGPSISFPQLRAAPTTQPPVIETANYHPPSHWTCGPFPRPLRHPILHPRLLKPYVLSGESLLTSLSVQSCSPSLHPSHQTSSNSDAQAVLTMYADRHGLTLHVQGVHRQW